MFNPFRVVAHCQISSNPRSTMIIRDKKVRSYQRATPWPARRTFIPTRGLTRCFVQIRAKEPQCGVLIVATGIPLGSRASERRFFVSGLEVWMFGCWDVVESCVRKRRIAGRNGLCGFRPWGWKPFPIVERLFGFPVLEKSPSLWLLIKSFLW